MKAPYTIIFEEPRFITQVYVNEPNELESEILASKWFKEVISTHLKIVESQREGVMIQMEQLDGLINTWSGWVGHQGIYAMFALVKADSVNVDSGKRYTPFNPGRSHQELEDKNERTQRKRKGSPKQAL